MTLEATRYEDGTISYPGHPCGPGGAEPVETIDLSEYTGKIVTWTTSTATPPGVREPNHLAIVEFDIGEASDDASSSRTGSDGEGQSVRAIGQLTTGDVETGDTIRPVHVDELREPGAGIREPESQEWDGYRFEPV
ncbi:PhlB family protein [Natrinema ejinorense]|uniref:Nucleic acid-binding protein n=1 Tax=Natrinema ejinorense TaxID=373386 RepID=A0A2A5QSN8_9EURY|nr:nucleic acid-binding protein [Natrinema ejinorense]PCR89799.1 nucleic acid-binding protein [Natrinema ejinorense]